MKVSKALMIAPLLSVLAMPALADDDYDDDYRHYRFEQRSDRQHWRIRQGIRSGELTRKEVKRLRKQQRRITKLEHKFARDGHLDRCERRVLRRKLAAASDQIDRLKHNGQYRDFHYSRRYQYNEYDPYRAHHSEPQRYDQPYDNRGWSVSFSLWDHL